MMRLEFTGKTMITPNKSRNVDCEISADSDGAHIYVESGCCCDGNISLNLEQINEAIEVLQEAKRLMNENLD